MSENKNQTEPLSKSKVLEDLANACQVYQTIMPFLGTLVVAIGSLQLQPNSKEQTVPTPPTTPPVVIHIHQHQQPPTDTALKFQQIQEKLNTIKESEDEDKVTLSIAKEAVSELQLLLQDQKAELAQAKSQLNLLNNEELSSEQIQAQQEIESYLQRVQFEIAKLNETRTRVEASQEAIDWLDPKKEDFFQKLAKTSGDAALASYPQLVNPGEVASVPQNLQQFYWDIEDFLRCIKTCLLVCRPNLLDTVIQENELPESPLPFAVYEAAFKFIRDEIVPSAISGQAAKEEITAYLNHLINIFTTGNITA
jgi:multidrug efflux pump subunit AcrA (membrane-fusion protein)